MRWLCTDDTKNLVIQNVAHENSFHQIDGAVGAGEVLVRALYISVDPYLAIRIRARSFEGGRIFSRLIGRKRVPD
jgi:NADPH-dependent curcumin reductase CurA